MQIKEYIEQHQEFFNNDTKIAYFKIGYILNKLYKRLTPEQAINFTKKHLLGLDYRDLTKDVIIYKLVPTLTNLNEEYSLYCDNLLHDISNTIIAGLEDLENDPVLFISLGMNLSNKFDSYIDIKEASKLFNKAESTLRLNIKNGKFKEGIDCKKFGNSWIFSIDALVREYGEIK